MNTTLSTYANMSAYSAILVLTGAMVAFALDLSRVAPRRTSRLRVPATVAAGGGPQRAPRPEPTPRLGDDPAPGRRLAGVGMALSWLGCTLLVAAATLRGLSVMRVPWGNMYEFSITGSAAVMLVFLGLSLRRDVRWLGVFVVTPVVLMTGLAVTVYYTEASRLLPSLRSFWLVIHVSIAIIATALFTIAFSVTIVQMVQARRESRDKPQQGFMNALPDAEALDTLAYGLHIAAFPLWTFTLIAGAIWAEKAWGAYWQWDPKEVWTFVIWVVYAAYLHARATAGWSTRSVNTIALAGYGCILVNYMVVNVYFVGLHSYSGM